MLLRQGEFLSTQFEFELVIGSRLCFQALLRFFSSNVNVVQSNRQPMAIRGEFLVKSFVERVNSLPTNALAGAVSGDLWFCRGKGGVIEQLS